MNKYRDKSDFEINKAVAVLTGAVPFPIGTTEFRPSSVSGMESAIIVKSPRKVGAFDPCNNPADAMPIVIENRISIESRFNGHYDEWYASRQLNKMHIDATGTNYYRVAMEVFLMMKDAENEKV
ncbi:phage protein NinX family protein [Morganella morganii]|uniref:phage protein NinX family protein n=1 Tax=Morganella morganii TaxID=582 RepID=UPI00345B4D16